MHKGFVRLAGAIAASAFALGACVAQAQGYPNRVVRIIVTSTAGGAQDFLARLSAEYLKQSLGQPFIVENRTGAGGNIAREYVAKSAPDGYTLLTSTNGLSINQAMYETLPYDALGSFEPVVLIAYDKLAIGGSALFAPASLAGLIAYAKEHPGAVTYASCGNGSLQHLAGEILQRAAQIRLVHVPYKGCPPAMPDALSGQVNVIITGVTALIPHVKSGKIKPYAVIGSKRSSFAPDLPATAELGLPEVDVDGWFGLLAPAGTPKEIVEKLNHAVNAMIASPDARARLARAYLDPIGGTPAEFSAVIRREISVFSKVIKAANIRPE